MLQELPIFLKAIDCKILIKYDGERSFNKYTIKLLYNNLRKGSLGKDTDYPLSVFAEIAEIEKQLPIKEIEKLFFVISEKFFDRAIRKCGKQCIALAKLEENDEEVYYYLHIETVAGSTYTSSSIFSDALTKVFEE